jgi:hypothetical protein
MPETPLRHASSRRATVVKSKPVRRDRPVRQHVITVIVPLDVVLAPTTGSEASLAPVWHPSPTRFFDRPSRKTPGLVHLFVQHVCQRQLRPPCHSLYIHGKG